MAKNIEVKDVLSMERNLDYMRGVTKQNIANGYCDAAPVGNYEGSLDEPSMSWDEDSKTFKEKHYGTRHAGNVDPDGFEAKHGRLGEYGFLRRPAYKTDVGRNE